MRGTTNKGFPTNKGASQIYEISQKVHKACAIEEWATMEPRKMRKKYTRDRVYTVHKFLSHIIYFKGSTRAKP